MSCIDRSRTVAAAIVALSLAGCAVGPNYQRPGVTLPVEHRGAEPAAAAPEPSAPESIADVAWWDLFADPVLRDLIDEALVNSYDMRLVAARIEQARFAVGTTRADLMPQVSYEGAASRGRGPAAGVANEVTGNQFFAAFQLAWEIDVWGRVRRSTEASLADLLAAEDVRRAVILSLVTGVAQAYLELRELDLELEIALRTEESFEETLALFTRQLEGGVGNKLATSRAAAALAATRAAIPEIERLIVAKENQLSILLGRAPGPIARGAVLDEQSFPPTIPAGLPAALLERRPDVLQAEQNVVAANAFVGVATANFLPRIGLTTLYGAQSSELENLLEGPGKAWSVAGSVLGPVFQGGRLYYGYKGSQAALDEATLAYERTVLIALGEVSNALVAREKSDEARRALEDQVEALREAVRLALLRYTGGFAGYFEVLDAQQQLFPAENALARARLNEHVTVVQLYGALGGGWRAEEERSPERYPRRRDALDRLVAVHEQ